MTSLKSPAQKRRIGNPGGHRLPQPIPTQIPSEVPLPPESLGPAGKEAWTTIWSAGWLALSDRLVVQLFCEGLDTRVELRARLADGMTASGSTGQPVAHPLVTVLDALETRLTKWASLLLLTPADRIRLGVGSAKRGETALATLARQRLQRVE